MSSSCRNRWTRGDYTIFFIQISTRMLSSIGKNVQFSHLFLFFLFLKKKPCNALVETVICHWNLQVSENMRWPWTSCYENFKCFYHQSKTQLTSRTKFKERSRAQQSLDARLGLSPQHKLCQVSKAAKEEKHWDLMPPNFRNTFTFKMWVLCNIMHASRVGLIQTGREMWTFSLPWNSRLCSEVRLGSWQINKKRNQSQVLLTNFSTHILLVPLLLSILTDTKKGAKDNKNLVNTNTSLFSWLLVIKANLSQI